MAPTTLLAPTKNAGPEWKQELERVAVIIPVEFYVKAVKMGLWRDGANARKKLLTAGVRVSNLFAFMPNRHSPDKICVGAWVDRTIAERLKKLAAERKMSLTQLLEALLLDQTRHISLDHEDYTRISQAIEKARQRQSATGAALEALDGRRKPKSKKSTS